MRYRVRVHPGAAEPRVALLADGTLAVWVQAPPVDGRANAAMVALLAQRLRLGRGDVALVRGARARWKLVEVPLDAAAVGARLSAG